MHEVIEGRGQLVTAETAGWYWVKNGVGKCMVVDKLAGYQFMADYRYLRIDPPEFPPVKPPFVAPPKPELVLVRFKLCGSVEWIRRGTPPRSVYTIIDQATGEPVGGGE